MPRRFDLGRAVLIAGSALLFISLFLEWYDVDASGWEVFEALDLVLTALAAAGIAVALRPDLLPAATAWAVPLAVLVIVFVQLVNDPPAVNGSDPATGAWIALGAGVLMAIGSSLSLTNISVTVQVRDRDVRRRVAAVDRRGDGDGDADTVAAAEDVEEAATRRDRGGLFTPPSSAVPPDEIERTQPLSPLDEPAEGTEQR